MADSAQQQLHRDNMLKMMQARARRTAARTAHELAVDVRACQWLTRNVCRVCVQANESLQKQLKELNGVVDAVVQRALGNPSSARPPRLPGAAFPAQAKPGAKSQRQTAAPPKKAKGAPPAPTPA